MPAGAGRALSPPRGSERRTGNGREPGIAEHGTPSTARTGSGDRDTDPEQLRSCPSRPNRIQGRSLFAVRARSHLSWEGGFWRLTSLTERAPSPLPALPVPDSPQRSINPSGTGEH